jgi:hypothetical protein
MQLYLALKVEGCAYTPQCTILGVTLTGRKKSQTVNTQVRNVWNVVSWRVVRPGGHIAMISSLKITHRLTHDIRVHGAAKKKGMMVEAAVVVKGSRCCRCFRTYWPSSITTMVRKKRKKMKSLSRSKRFFRLKI